MAIYIKLFPTAEDYPYNLEDEGKGYSYIPFGTWWDMADNTKYGPIISVETGDLVQSGSSYLLPYDVEYSGDGWYCVSWKNEDLRGKYVLASQETEQWDWRYQSAEDTGNSPFNIYKRVGDDKVIYTRADLPDYRENRLLSIFVFDSEYPELNRLVELNREELAYMCGFKKVPSLPEPVPGVAYIRDIGMSVYNGEGSGLFPPTVLDQEGTFSWESVGFTEELYQTYVDEVLGLNPNVNKCLNVRILGENAEHIEVRFYGREDLYGRNCELDFSVWGDYNGTYGVFEAYVDYRERTVRVSFSEYDG